MRSSAALHYGLIDEHRGGCGLVQQIGAYTNFVGAVANGISSFSYPSTFMSAFTFQPLDSSDCVDYSDYLALFNILMMTAFVVVFVPRAPLFFWTLVCLGHWHVSLNQPRAWPLFSPLKQLVV